MTKKLIVILVMVVLLGALSLSLFLLKRQDEPPPPVPDLPDLEYLINYRDDTFGGLASVEVRNGQGEFTVLPGSPPSIPGWESLIVNTYPLTRIMDICSGLISQGLVVEEAANLGVYGLETPLAEVEIRTNSGEGTTLYIGGDVPGGLSVYVRVEGDPAVYRAARGDVSSFFQGVLDLVDKEVSPQLPDDGYGGFDFEEITLGGTLRADGVVRIVHREEENVPAGRLRNDYLISGPYETSLNLEEGFNALKAIPGIYADRAVGRAAGDLAPYGLDKPYSTASISGTLGQGLGGFSLRASKPDGDGNVYIWREGTELVYQVASSKLPWLEAGWWDLMNRMIIIPYIDDIARVEVNSPQRRLSFSLSGEGEDLKVEAQGAELDTSFFRSYYQTLLSAIYDDYAEERIPPGAQPVLEIVYHYRDGRPQDRVSFYASSSRRVLTSLNGGRPFYTYAAYITKVQTDLDRLLEGKKVLPYL
ncbi:MAG: DUF4340 domain-containing protein [Treponema sp.]|jgi:hypothetical protein|nr:DUF4340 domain-containing protein [Treponema sp.]